MSTNPVSTLSVSFDPYVRAGWHLVPIPPGSKGPRQRHWNTKENCITDPNQIPAGYGVGLAHAYSGTMALDVDDWTLAEKYLADHDVDLRALFEAPDAVQIHSGNPGHGKLLYAMPFGAALLSKRLIARQADGTQRTHLEFRCATTNGLTCQDVLPPTIHPVSLQPYQWAGLGHWQRLPTIPCELLNVWTGLLAADGERNITLGGTIDASWNEIRAALNCIPPDVDRSDWIACGMALHHAGHQTGQPEQAMLLWDEWSSNGAKYKGRHEITSQWQSFQTREDGIALGTLFHLARRHGWVRTMPDVSGLFGSIKPASPISALNALDTPAPEADLSLFPPVLVARAEELSKRIGSDPLVSLFAGLGAVCGAVDARTRLRLMPGWDVPPVLWLMTVGDPAEKKTPASTPMMQILSDLEHEDLGRYAKALQVWELYESAHVSSKKAADTAARDPASMGPDGKLIDSAIPTIHALPDKPVPLRLTATDVTSQKLVRMVADRPRGMLIYLDEMKAWADKVTTPQSGEDRSAWTQGYEAGRYSMDRVGNGTGTGSTLLDTYALAIYGNIQPRVLKAKMTALSLDGMLQRFLPAILRQRYSDVVGEPGEDRTNAEAYEMMVRQVAALPVMQYEMSPGAYAAFREMQHWHLRLKQDDRLLHASDDYMQAMGKLEGTCGRMILIWHLCTSPYATHVSEATARACIAVLKSYIVPALRYIYGELSGANKNSLERWLIEYVVQISGDRSQISMRDLKRTASRRLEGIDDRQAEALIRDAIYPMEQWGWLIETTVDRRSTTWAVSPSLAIDYEGHRREVLAAKQRRQDSINAMSSGPARILS